VPFAHAVYVLHAFQKKSKAGIATPGRELELIRQRLREAQEIAKRREDEQKDV
jgi:phage-related protein